VFLWAGCTTEKNTFLTRTYHNTTAHFNGYFWGNLSYEEGLKKLNDIHKDDYSSLLPVFVYAEDKEAPTIYPEMDRAINKAKTMIENHTITNKQKREIPDAVKYIKYCYLLLAKARLYKNEYLTAIDAVNYASKVYRKSSVKYEAIMWEVRALDQIGSVSQAEELVDLLTSSKEIPKKLYPEVCATVSDYYMRTGEYNEVAKWLKKAIPGEKVRSSKARYLFILAQISQRESDPQMAFSYYSKVIRSHPTYDLDFEANINRALLFLGDDKENQHIIKMLKKMLKPTKNIDNRDQIYYALAQISEKQGDTAQAITYLNKSVHSSTTNALQKSISFLALADLCFNREDYIHAKRYYDSTLVALPKKYKGRDSIVDKRDNLQKLVKYLDVIAVDDSVIKLSSMDKKSLDKYIDKLIADAKKEAEEKKQKEAEQEALQQQLQANANPNTIATGGTNSSWYFYNPGQIQLGTTEFLKTWGNRVLEDDWRRSKKISLNVGGANGEGVKKGADSVKGKVTAQKKDSLNDIYSRAYYMKNIPQGANQVKALNDSLVEAYYNAGSIYKEYLKNNKKSSEEFEELLKRYPDNKYKLTTYYQLYRIYTENGNTERANYYKNILLTQYPNTEYAQLISNPEKYKQNLQASKEEMERLYTATLQSYESAKYMEVLHGCQQADSLYPKNPLSAKFAYLEAVAIGYTQGLDAYKNALTKVILLYPKDSVKLLAQTTLAYLNKKPAVKDTVSIKYTTDIDSSYYFIVLIDNTEPANKINTFRNTLSNLNSKSYAEDKLQMDNLMLDANHQMLFIKLFKTVAKAKDYYTFVNGNNDLFTPFSQGACQIFYISDKNFHLMLNHRKADEYVQFFKDKLK
jgi:tetratricopeptide (TPR) repeat protein